MDLLMHPIVRHALELAIMMPCALMAFIPVRRYLRRDFNFVFTCAACALLAFIVLGSLACSYLGCPTNLICIASLPLFLALYSYQVGLNQGKVVFCFFLAAHMGAYASVLTAFLMAPLEVTNPDITFLPVSSMICLALANVLTLVFYRTLDVKLAMLMGTEELNGTWTTAAIAAMVLTAAFVWINPNDFGIIMEGRVRMMALLALLLVPLVELFAFDVVWKLFSHLVENTRLKQENNMLSLEERRYAQLRGYMENTRSIRHDFRQHLRVISDLAHNDRNDELIEYIDELGSSALTQEHVQACENLALDAIVAYYDSVARQQGTTIDWKVEVPARCFVKDSDLCSVVGNLVENAVQAVSALPDDKRNIQATVRMLSDAMLGITVRNPYDGEVHLGRSGLPRTHQASGHGIGLPSVKTIVKSYDGTMTIDTANKIFVVSVLMYGETD